MSVFKFEDILLTHLECDQIIDLVSHIGLTQSTVSGSGESDRIVSTYRTSHNLKLYHGDNNLLDNVHTRIANIVGKQALNVEIEVNRYYIGQHFVSHYDFLPPIRFINTGGQRLYSCIIYLNDNFEGGETYFSQLAKTIIPVKGKAVLWRNCIEGTSEPDYLSLHESIPVTKGEKWALIAWIREGEFKKPLQTTN